MWWKIEVFLQGSLWGKNRKKLNNYKLMPGPSAPSKIFERDQKILNVVKKFWTCSKFFGRVQKIWMWCKITKNGKNLKKKMCSKFLNMAKIFLNTSKTFQRIQNFLNMFKIFWTEQMDRAKVSDVTLWFILQIRFMKKISWKGHAHST